jgi:hypothetical protein
MKTSELSGVALDWAVAKAEGVTCAVWQGMAVDEFSNPLMYHDDWALGGPIIEREGLAISRVAQDEWSASLIHEDKEYGGVMYTNEHGTTPLIAAMRCYVASKLGDEVQLPEGLHKT